MMTHETSRFAKRAVVSATLGIVSMLGAGAGRAQGSDSGAILIVAVFQGPGAADSTLNGMTQQLRYVKSYAVVSKDQNGGVSLRQNHRMRSDAAGAPAANDAIDGAIALLGHPLPPSRPNNQATHISQSKADRIATMLTPGNSAIILVVPELDADRLESDMRPAGATDLLDARLEPTP
jgi:hypothetical protein